MKLVTKPAEEEQTEIPQADEIQSSEQNPQDEEQADPTPPPEQDEPIPQPDAQPEQAPQPDAQPEPSPQPEAPADEIPHPEDNAEENAPDQDNAFVVLNPETAIVVSPPVPQQNLQPVQRQPFSKRPQFQKENFFEERMYFIGGNPYDKPQMRHLKFWTRTQLNYYASVLCGRKKIFQHRHIPHVELEAIPCLEPVLNVLHDAGLLPMCSDISDWNSELILQFYATLHISGNPEDINTWVFDWMTQNTHYKAPATELLRELPIPIPSEEAVKLYATSSKSADDSVPAASSKPADESAEKTPSPKASKVNKMTPSASDVKKTRAVEKEAKKRKIHQQKNTLRPSASKHLKKNAPLDPVPLNIAPSYEMVTFEDQEKRPDEEMKEAESEEHTNKEIRIDESPQPSIPHEETAQGSAAPADKSGSVTKQAKEEQTENPQADESHSPEKNLQPEDQADPTPPPEHDPQTEAQDEPIPPPEQNLQQDAPVDDIPQPEAQADEIPHPEDHAGENAPDQDNAFVVLNPESAIVVFDRTWATLAHLKTLAELEELEFAQDFDSWPPKKKFRRIPVLDLEDSSFSSFRTAESDEEQQDTATGPRKKTAPKNPHASSSAAKE
ncbi:hypothetical protein ZWY2020_022434 [Hordeum vulgare]|nr:hypothetical protein ZWY2020_022434 [Hordeum vulgare]